MTSEEEDEDEDDEEEGQPPLGLVSLTPESVNQKFDLIHGDIEKAIKTYVATKIFEHAKFPLQAWEEEKLCIRAVETRAVAIPEWATKEQYGAYSRSLLRSKINDLRANAVHNAKTKFLSKF